MRYKQMSLFDIYSGIDDMSQNNCSGFFKLLREHIDWDRIIPIELENAYYAETGRPREYSLISMLLMLVLKAVFGFRDDTQLLDVLHVSREFRRFCDLDNRIPNAAQVTRFRTSFGDYLQIILANLVEITEPICREMNPELADCLAVDTTGIKSYVKENNDKFFNSKLRQAKAMCKGKSDANPYTAVYGLLPEVAEKNHAVKQQYINGHFCYAQKFVVITNGLGIVRGIYQLGEDFKQQHSEMTIPKRTDNPDIDKEISDSAALKPILTDFFTSCQRHTWSTFLGDSAFDSYDNYALLMNEFEFDKVLIPLNGRNSVKAHDGFDANGIPLCPKSGNPMKCLGNSGGKNRSDRIKFVCPESVVKNGKRVCKCANPCSTSTYGHTAYVYPSAELREFPGMMRGTEQWTELYKNRTAIERTIGYFKNNFAVTGRKTSNVDTTRADFLIAGITQLLGVVIADKIHKHKLARSLRRLLRTS